MSRLILKAQDICKSFGPLVLLDGVSLTMSSGDRLALVGSNGCGKSTFAKILLGQEGFDTGTVERASGVEIGYLPQDITDFLPDSTIQEYLMATSGDLQSLTDCMRLLEQKMADPAIAPHILKETMDEWNLLHEKLEHKGGYSFEHRIEEVLKGLELDQHPLDTSLSQLSGGERTRVALSALLLSSPQLLILDEPTNNLDVTALEWLENYLQNYSGALLLISHDRSFINQVVNKIVELSTNLTTYGGSYQFYLDEKEKEKERKLKEYEERKEEIQQLRELIKGKIFSKGKATPAKDRNIMAYDRRGERHLKGESRIIEQAKAKLEELEKEPLVHPSPKTIKGIYFDPLPLLSDQALSFSNLSKSYDSPLFVNIAGSLQKNQRIILKGLNGCGKTTLFKILLGQEPPDSGTITIAPSVKIGYLDQHLEQSLPHNTVYEDIALPFNLSETDLRKELHKSGLLTESILGQTIGSLSPGQKKKLAILKLMLSQCNLLLLDEPTNHLDLATMESLEKALLSFPGPILAISHDRWFNSRIATHSWHMENKNLTISN